MNENNILARKPKSFEELKQINQFGAEYWSARDLQPMLGYNHWRSFDNAVSKAITSCEKSGNEPMHHFARARKPIIGGKGAVQIKAFEDTWHWDKISAAAYLTNFFITHSISL